MRGRDEVFARRRRGKHLTDIGQEKIRQSHWKETPRQPHHVIAIIGQTRRDRTLSSRIFATMRAIVANDGSLSLCERESGRRSG